MARPSTPEERAQMVRQLYEMQREEAEREHAGRNGANAEADDGEPVEPRTIADVADTFRRWLYFPHNDLGVLNVSLGTAAANHYDTDPGWLLNVGPSSGGKTEVILAIAGGLKCAHHAAVLTEASLLSGSPKRDHAIGAKGGLLRDIGDFGILVMKDFTSVLSMNRDQRGALLAALREIYDGSWTRHVGTDGGRTLHWSGKLGLIAGCTTAIDTHHAVMATMGERFLLNRLPPIDPTEQAARALDNTGHEAEMRRELVAVVRGLFAGLNLQNEPLPAVEERERCGLIALSSLVAAARSGVERDGYRRELEFVHDTEAPARLAVSLRRLYAGMLGIGLSRMMAWPLVVKVGLDCIPKPRRAVLDVLLDAPGYMNTTDISTAADLPTVTARRALEDLTAHHVCERLSGGSGKADVWRISDTARQRYATATATFSETSGADAEKPPEPTVSETSGANEKTVTTPNTVMNDFSEKVPLKDVDTSPVTEDDVADLFGDVVAECRGCGGSVDSGQAYCFACDSR